MTVTTIATDGVLPPPIARTHLSGRVRSSTARRCSAVPRSSARSGTSSSRNGSCCSTRRPVPGRARCSRPRFGPSSSPGTSGCSRPCGSDRAPRRRWRACRSAIDTCSARCCRSNGANQPQSNSRRNGSSPPTSPSISRRSGARLGRSGPVLRSVRRALHARPDGRRAEARVRRRAREALRNRGRWALFAMREEFVAQLDPYVDLLPTLLRTRYRLDLLTAVGRDRRHTRPLVSGVEISQDAAERLVDDLRSVKVQRGGATTKEPGPYVEPVQLQVVCRQLWDRPRSTMWSIELPDVLALGEIDRPLAEYYAEQVRDAAAGESGSRSARSGTGSSTH